MKVLKILLTILKWFLIIDAVILILLIVARVIGKAVNNRTPEGGINETQYLELNGTKQWVQIYGQDASAPVLLYLHGGPFGATSAVDWTCLRKLSKDYIVVNWDQRGCGHNYPEYKESAPVSAETLLQDASALTDYLRERFRKEKITLMGMSFGSLLGANLALRTPEKYDAMIALSLVVDIEESQSMFREYMLEQTKDEPELHRLAENMDVTSFSRESRMKLMPLINKYGHADNFLTEADVNFYGTVLFNPYCTAGEMFRMVFGSAEYNDYQEKVLCPDFNTVINPLSLRDRTAYEIPFYVIEGRSDHGDMMMAEEAAAYFEKVTAPDKELVYVEGGHNAPMMQTEKLAQFVHSIAQKTQTNGHSE